MNEETLLRTQEQYPDLAITKNSRDLLEETELEAIVIATSASSHYPKALEACFHDKHVLIEKMREVESSLMLQQSMTTIFTVPRDERSDLLIEREVSAMSQMILEFPDEIIEELKQVSTHLDILPEELIKRSITDYLQKLTSKAKSEFEPIGFGMWAGRTDMEDSVQWVRNLRKQEWSRS